MRSPERLQKLPLLPVIQNIRADDQIKPLAQLIDSPIQSPRPRACDIDLCKQQRLRLHIRQHHSIPHRRRNHPRESHPASQIQSALAPAGRAPIHQKLSDAKRAVPQLRPVRQVQFITDPPLAAELLAPILLGHHLIQYRVEQDN